MHRRIGSSQRAPAAFHLQCADRPPVRSAVHQRGLRRQPRRRSTPCAAPQQPDPKSPTTMRPNCDYGRMSIDVAIDLDGLTFGELCRFVDHVQAVGVGPDAMLNHDEQTFPILLTDLDDLDHLHAPAVIDDHNHRLRIRAVPRPSPGQHGRGSRRADRTASGPRCSPAEKRASSSLHLIAPRGPPGLPAGRDGRPGSIPSGAPPALVDRGLADDTDRAERRRTQCSDPAGCGHLLTPPCMHPSRSKPRRSPPAQEETRPFGGSSDGLTAGGATFVDRGRRDAGCVGDVVGCCRRLPSWGCAAGAVRRRFRGRHLSIRRPAADRAAGPSTIGLR